MTTPAPPTATIAQPIRQFRIGTTNLPDPDPAMPPDQVFALYSASYPALKFATIETPRMEGEILVVEAKLPTVQTKGATKGATKAAPDPLDQLAAWMAAPAQSPTASGRWAPVFGFLSAKLRDPAQPHIDAFLLPLA